MPSAIATKFKVGDKVRMVKMWDGFMSKNVCVVYSVPVGIANDIYVIQTEEQGTWSVPENVIEFDAPKKEEKKVKATKENTVHVKLERRPNGKTYFSFQVPKRITELYKTRAVEVKESKSWVGLKFYSVPELIKDTKYKEKLGSYQLFDDFGDGFVKIVGGSYLLNIAWIRTVDGEGEFEVKNELGHSELNMLVKNMLEFLKNYFEDHFRSFSIKGSLTIDF